MRLIDADKLKFVPAMIEPILVGDEPHWETIILKDRIDAAPTVDAVPVVRCKDCKHFDLDHFEKVGGIPIIVAHEICMFWGRGCRTKSDGYCSFGERKNENSD